MVIVSNIFRGENLAFDTFASLRENFREHRARLAVYKDTVRELSVLDDRELNDLGLCRADITTVAKQAAKLR